MEETLVNIYVIIESNKVSELRAVGYTKGGSDDEKLDFLREQAAKDFGQAIRFDAPTAASGKPMSYSRFHRHEKKGEHSMLYREIFTAFETPDNPLICVTPVMDGKVLIPE